MKEPSLKNAPKVLVADDQEGIRLTLKGILTQKGYVVTEAESGDEAVAKASAGRFQLVLMDVKMPGLDGYAAMAKMKAARPDLPVILMTALAEDDPFRAEATEAYAVVAKPFDMNDLLKVVEECVRAGS